MPGPLTLEEQAQIRDHLGWSNAQIQSDYVTVWVNSAMETLTEEAKLSIVRGHLDKLNTIQNQIIEATGNFELDKVGNIEFSSKVELRLWSLHFVFVTKLAIALNIELNPDVYGGGNSERDIE